jgi:hypothetical protein
VLGSRRARFDKLRRLRQLLDVDFGFRRAVATGSVAAGSAAFSLLAAGTIEGALTLELRLFLRRLMLDMASVSNGGKFIHW